MDIWLDEDVNFVSTPSWNEIARGKLVMMDFAKTQEMFGGRGNAINFVMDYASNKGEIVLFDILVMPFETKKDFYTGEDITKSVQCLCVLPHREE